MNLSSLLRAGDMSCTSARSRLLRVSFLRMALLAAIMTALSTTVDATPVIDNVAFQQLDWWGEDGTLLVPNSLWGRISYSYVPESARSYLNVTVAHLSGDPVWVVQNVPLFEIEHGNGSERRECIFIDLETLGLNEGDGWVNVYYRISVDGAPRITPPTPASAFSLVQPFDCRMLNIPMDPALPDSVFLDPFASFAPLSDSIRAEPIKTGTSRDLNEVQEQFGYCVAGACARALDELNRRFGLRIIADAQDIYFALGVRGVGDWRLGRGPALYAEWIRLKDLYAKEKSNNRVVTKVWDAGDCGSPVLYPQGQIAPIPGVEESSGDFLEWLKSEWEKGENVEIAYYSKVAGGFFWHMVSVNDVYDSEGSTYVDIRTDLVQDDDSKGDK